MPLDATIGPCRVIEIKDHDMIKVEEIKQYPIKKGDRVLFKTRNSPAMYEGRKFPDSYVYFSDESAEYLVEKGVIFVGLDSLTIGNYKDEPSVVNTHIIFLRAGVYVLEGCALGHVPPGEYELMCLPLLMYNGDAGPSRAILRPLSK
jgi:arylformamidase